MQYRIVPFEPQVGNSNPTKAASDALAALVQAQSSEGWEFRSIENHSTVVPGSNGCFGFGATSP